MKKLFKYLCLITMFILLSTPFSHAVVELDSDTDGYIDIDYMPLDELWTFEAGVTISTTKHLTVGTTQWDDGSDKIEGNILADDSVDQDAMDFTSITLGDFTDDLGADSGHTHTGTTLSAILYSDITAFTETNLYTRLSDVTQFYEAGDENTIAGLITAGSYKNDSVQADDIDLTDFTSTDLTFDAHTVPTTAVSVGAVGLDHTTSATDSGAYIVGVYDEFDNSTQTTVQGVLNDLDAAIAGTSGDVTSTGSVDADGCVSGACLDGSVDGGKNISFYDAQGATKITVGDNAGAVTLTLPTATGTLLTSQEINTPAELETVSNSGAYASDILATTSAANLVSTLGITTSIAELNYVTDVTGLIQAQMDLKAPLTAPTFITGITLTGADADPATTGGNLRFDTTVTGLETGALAWYDGDEIRYLVDLDTLPVNDGYFVSYNATDDRFVMADPSSTATDFALTADADAGNYDIKSLNGLYGLDDSEYIDMGGDLIDITSDVLITATSPDLRLGVDSLAYLKVVTANAGATTISAVSDGTDRINIGDGGDRVDIASDSWDVTNGAIANVTTIGASGIVTLTNATEASAIDTAALVTSGGLGVALDAWIGDDLVLDSDSTVISFGADQDVTLTHTADTGLAVNLNLSAATYGSTGAISDAELLDLENDTHASEHTIGGADIIDRLFEGATAALATLADTNTDFTVVSKGLYYTHGLATVTIDDFSDADQNHSEYSDGDYFGILMDDGTVTIDFSANANIEGNAGQDFTDSASDEVLLLFTYYDGTWYCMNYNSGFSNPTTLAIDKAQFDYTIANPQSLANYDTDDTDYTVGTEITSSVVLVDGINNGDDDSIDLQDAGAGYDGMYLTFTAYSDIDASDTFSIDAETDSTCTNCPYSGIFELAAIGESVTLRWDNTNSTWTFISWTGKMVDYSGETSTVGWDGETPQLYYSVSNDTVFVRINVTDTSNHATTTFTVPFTSNATSGVQFPLVRCQDNGSYLDTGWCSLAANSTTVTCYTNNASATWTNSGTKQINGIFSYFVK